MKLIDRFVGCELIINVAPRDRGAEPRSRGREYLSKNPASSPNH